MDGDKTNCRADNLEWMTQMENHQHACDTGLNKHFKLSANDKHYIFVLRYDLNAPVKQIAKIVMTSESNVRRHIKN
jgi:DNA-binding MarR family transcriptional regulator